MKALLQRVKNASVTINGELYSKIGHGILVLFCAEKGDTEEHADWLVSKILKLRIFEDENDKMNRSITDINGELLVVSQFTLAADCKKGTRPSFDNAMSPNDAKSMYEKFCKKLEQSGLKTQTGVFAAMMDVELINDGPVTVMLESSPQQRA